MNQSVKDLIKDLSNRYDAIGRNNDPVTCDLLLQAEAMIEGLAQEVAAERNRLAEITNLLSNEKGKSNRYLEQCLAAQQEVRSLKTERTKAEKWSQRRLDQVLAAQQLNQKIKALLEKQDYKLSHPG